MIIQFPTVGIHGGKAIFAAIRCCAAEGGTSGKNSATDQRQSQNTTGTTGSDSPNLTAQDQGTLSLGPQASSIYGSSEISFTDQGAVEKAFQFGEKSIEILAGAGGELIKAQTQSQAKNNDFLNEVLGSFSAQTDAGQAANSNKTMLYLVGGGLALVAVIFLFRKA